MASSSKFLNTVVLNNWSLKLLALILASLSFYAIRGATSFEVPYDIPLEVELDEKSGIAILDQPETVRVTFRGSREDLAKLDQKQIHVVVKPEASDPAGVEVVKISRKNITVPSGVLVEHIEPSSVSLSFDHEITKKFNVLRPKTRGTPLRGRVELDWTPDMVVVRGSKSRLEQVRVPVAETEPVNVDGRVESFSERVRILPPSDAGVWEIDPPEITVKVSIVTETISRAWTNVPVKAIMDHGTRSDVSFKPDQVSVSLSGSEEAVNSVTRSQVKLFVDCAGLKSPGEYELPVNVHLPVGIEVNASVVPEKVKVVLATSKSE